MPLLHHPMPAGLCRRLLAMLLGMLLLSCLAPARAGGLSVLPTRLDMGQGQGVQSVLLTNTSAQTVTVETQVVVWPEGAGGQLASDVVVTPAVITLPPNQRMRVRVGLLRQGDATVERAYRLYFTELPAPSPLQAAGVGVRLRVGIPVFVAPAVAQPQALQWALSEAAGAWQLEARNEGNVHTRLGRPLLVAGEQQSPLPLPSPYVLAGTVLRIPLPARPPAGARVRWLDGDDERSSVVPGL